MNAPVSVVVGAFVEQWRLCNAARGKEDEYCRRPKCKRCNRLRLWYAAGGARSGRAA